MDLSLKDFMTPEFATRVRIDELTADQQAALIKWGFLLRRLGQHVVSDIRSVKFDGRLVILDDDTRWEVDSADSATADLWSPGKR